MLMPNNAQLHVRNKDNVGERLHSEHFTVTYPELSFLFFKITIEGPEHL